MIENLKMYSSPNKQLNKKSNHTLYIKLKNNVSCYYPLLGPIYRRGSANKANKKIITEIQF